tara:strand:- start:2099 stop:2851 length:753 start_codon:yes stop_codon:yes gene_type:complete
MTFHPFIVFAALSLSAGALIAQEGTEAPPTQPAPKFTSKSMDQLTGDEVLRLVRYSYTLFNRDFTGVLRVGLVKKVPFLMSLKPESIRFIFESPSQIIYLDTRNNKFSLFEGVDGKELAPVAPGKYGEQIRGTDATYDDLSMRFLYWPDAKLVKLDRIKERNCWMVRVRNPDGAGAYSTVDVWIDKGSGGMLKMIGYNQQGRPIRRFEVLHGKKFGDIWMIDEMRIETIDPGAGGRVTSSTRMQIKSTTN